MATTKKKQSRAKKAGSGPKKREKVNAVDLAILREYFDEVHALTDKMEQRNAATRQNIGKTYERAVAATKLTKAAIMTTFRAERRLMKEEAHAEEKGTSQDRDSYLQIWQAFGDDTAIGRWAKHLADLHQDEGEEPEEETEEEAAPQGATVHALRAPAH